jgi:hypothetical protein
MYASIRPAARAHAADAVIHVSSQPATKSGTEPMTFLKILGSHYRLTEVYYEVSARLCPHRWAVNRWQRDPDDYSGGHFHRGGKRVEDWASARPRLEEIAKATLDQFTADVPQWKQESVRLCLLRDWENAQAAVTRREAQLRDAQAEERQAYAALHHTADDAGAEVPS